MTHAHMQIDRLGWAMRVAAEAMAERRRQGDRAVHQGDRPAGPLLRDARA